MTKFTAQHFPKGTIVSTSLYKTSDTGEMEKYYFGTGKSFHFTVDHVIVVDTFTGRNTLIVTTTQKEEPLFEGDEYITFHIDHVDKIVKMGHVNDIRYKWERWTRNAYFKEMPFDEHEISMFLSNYFVCLQPLNQFNYKLAAEAFVKSNAVKVRKHAFQSRFLHRQQTFRLVYAINKKKAKQWVKQNINRFILTQKEIQDIIRTVDEQMARDYEKDFDSYIDETFGSLPFDDSSDINITLNYD